MDRWRNRKSANRMRVMVTDENGKAKPRANFEEAFGFAGYHTTDASASDVRLHNGYDESIRLAPYPYPQSGEMTPAMTVGSDSQLPRYPGTVLMHNGQEYSINELRAVHVHSPDPAELKRFDIDSKDANLKAV